MTPQCYKQDSLHLLTRCPHLLTIFYSPTSNLPNSCHGHRSRRAAHQRGMRLNICQSLDHPFQLVFLLPLGDIGKRSDASIRFLGPPGLYHTFNPFWAIVVARKRSLFPQNRLCALVTSLLSIFLPIYSPFFSRRHTLGKILG